VPEPPNARYENGSLNTTAAIPGVQAPEPDIYTREQRNRADKVRMLHDQMHCSDDSLKCALNNGLIIGAAITSQDVDVYRAIYGPCLSCMACKVTKPSYRQDSEAPPATAVAQVIHVDLLKLKEPIIGGFMNQLFSVDEFTGYKHITQIKNKSITSINYSFCDLILHYRKHGWQIKGIVCDSESVLKAARVYLGHQGITLTHTPPHQHAQRCERHIRTMKDRARTITASIPYVLPLKLYGEVYKASVYHLNHLPSKHSNTTPTMQVENRKMDLRRLHTVPFGTIIQIHTPKQPNNSYPRGELGIVLGPCECTYNAVNTYAIYSKKLMVRHQYTVYKFIPKDFPFKLHNQPTTPAALIKKVHKENKDVIKAKKAKEVDDNLKEPDDLSLREAQELLDQLGSDTAYPLPIPKPAELATIQRDLPPEPPLPPIQMRVPLQSTLTTTTQETETEKTGTTEPEVPLEQADTNITHTEDNEIAPEQIQTDTNNIQTEAEETPDPSASETESIKNKNNKRQKKESNKTSKEESTITTTSRSCTGRHFSPA
jgi:hypothetical protein